MYKNYKFDEQVTTNFIQKYIKLTEPQKQITLIIYYTKSKTSNLIVKITQTAQKISSIELM